MKIFDVARLGCIAIALIFLYKGSEQLVELISYSGRTTEIARDGFDFSGYLLLRSTLFLSLFLIIGRFSRKIAVFLTKEKSTLADKEPEN